MARPLIPTLLILLLSLPVQAAGSPAPDPLQRMAQQLAAKSAPKTLSPLQRMAQKLAAKSHAKRKPSHHKRRHRRRRAHRRHTVRHPASKVAHRKPAHRKSASKSTAPRVSQRPKASSRPVRLTPMELVHLQAGKDAIAQMRQALQQVLAELDRAKKNKNVVKLNCLGDKAARMKALLELSEGSQKNLLAAYHQHEARGSDHPFTTLTVARNEVDALKAQANLCVGQLAFRADGSFAVSVEVPLQAPGGGPAQPQLPPPIPVRPPPASPTL